MRSLVDYPTVMITIQPLGGGAGGGETSPGIVKACGPPAKPGVYLAQLPNVFCSGPMTGFVDCPVIMIKAQPLGGDGGGGHEKATDDTVDGIMNPVVLVQERPDLLRICLTGVVSFSAAKPYRAITPGSPTLPRSLMALGFGCRTSRYLQSKVYCDDDHNDFPYPNGNPAMEPSVHQAPKPNSRHSENNQYSQKSGNIHIYFPLSIFVSFPVPALLGFAI